MRSKIRLILGVLVFLIVLVSAFGYRSSMTQASEMSRREVRNNPASPVSAVVTSDDRPLASFAVINTADSGAGSLRQAILDANASVGADSITISVTGTINLIGTLPTIAGPVTIIGPGANQLAIRRATGADFRILNFAAGQTSSISGVTVTNGSVIGDGGGILNNGTLTIIECTISGNTATGFGGGIENIGNLIIDRSTIANNTTLSSQSGGGIDNISTLVIRNSTISGNIANVVETGGGIFSFGGTAAIVNSTITNNQSSATGGASGIRAENSSVTLKNTIIAANQSNASIPDVFTGPGGSFVSNGFNLIGNRGAVTFAGQSDQSGTVPPLHPYLGTLIDNGGPTPTHSLLNGSPAIDKGSNVGSGATTDQSGETRPVNLSPSAAPGGDESDIGAFEAQILPACPVPATPITYGQTVNGTIGIGDCFLAGDRQYDRFSFTGTAGQRIAISMNSTALNAFLELYSGGFPGGGFIADDDNGGGGTNARIPAGSGFLTLGSSGTHTIVVRPLASGESGDYSLALELGETTPPTAVGTAPNVTAVGGIIHVATVVYSDNVAINAGTVGFGDIRVTGPNGFSTVADFQNMTPAGNGTPRTATYPFQAPGGSWEAGDNGTYNIVMEPSQVADTTGNFVAAGTIGSFTVNAPCPVISVNPSSLPGGMVGTSYSQTVSALPTDTYGFLVTSGALPPGLTLASGTGLISGSPTAAGTFTFTIVGTATSGCSGGQAYTVIIAPAPPPGLTVSNLNDSGAGSLRQAILNANANASTPDTITFQPGLSGTIRLTSGELVINDSLTIVGPGATVLTVSGNNASRIFNVNGSHLVSLGGMRITGGNGTGLNSGSGGGILSLGPLSVVNSIVTGNTASTQGGGIACQGNLTITDSTISSNTTSSIGGGIVATLGSFNLIRSTISGNTSTASGGGINLQNVSGSIVNSTISGNTNSGNAGGILYLASNGNSFTLQIANSTIASNTGSNGGGIRSVAQGTTGSSATVSLRNTIVANNALPNLNTAIVGTVTATITSQGYNLTNDNGGGFLTQTSDQLNANPLLSPLASNGGTTQTHALQTGSAAIDKGSNSGSPLPTTDQRGSARVVDLAGIANAAGGDGTDVGAYELQSEMTPPNANIVDVTPDPRTTSVSSVNVVFSEAVIGFNLPDLSLTRNGGSNLLTGSQTLTTDDNITYTLGNLTGVTGSPGTYVLMLTAAGSGISDTSGNALAGDASDTWVNNSVDPANFTVTNLSDSGVGSLRQAILNANANAPTPDTITFQSGLSGTITLTSGELVINDNLTIVGPGVTALTVSGNSVSRVFNVNGSHTVTLSGMRITGGNGTGLNSGSGGAILNLGSLSIANSVVTGSTASVQGGGVASQGNLTITDSTISANTSSTIGGGIVATLGNFNLIRSTISGNTSTASGGGVNLQNVSGSIVNSTISGNTNSSGNAGGILYLASNGNSFTLQIANSTIASNTGSNGGGIRSVAQGTTGSSATVSLRNTIVANNALPNLNTAIVGTVTASITSQGYNLTNDNGGGFLTQSTDQLNTNPLLSPLANNGGATQTHAIQADSPAVDKGSNSGSPLPTTDQRGSARLIDFAGIANAAGGDGTDIGAFELQSLPVPPFASVSGSVFSPTGLVLRNAEVTLTDSLGVTRKATTGSFGTYMFDNVATGQNYTVSVSSNRYRFATQSLTLNGNVTNLNFVGLE